MSEAKRTRTEQDTDEEINGFVDQEWPPFRSGIDTGDETDDSDTTEGDEKGDNESEGNEGGENATYTVGLHPDLVAKAAQIRAENDADAAPDAVPDSPAPAPESEPTPVSTDEPASEEVAGSEEGFSGGSFSEGMSADDAERYRKRLSGEAAEEEGEFGGETNETVKKDHGKVVTDEEGNPVMRKRAAEGNLFDYTPKVEGENNADYGARLRWQKMMAEKIATDPMTEEDIRYKENGERDMAASEAAWRERVGVPSLAEYRGGDGVDAGAEEGAEDDSDEARKAAEQSLVDTLNQVLQKKAEEAGAEEPLKPFDIKDIENPTGDDLAYEAWLKSNAMPEEEPEEPEETGPDKPFDTRDIENPTQDDLSYEAWLRSNANPDQLDADGNPTGAVTPDKPFDINDIENPTEDDKAYEAWLKSNANPELGSEVRQDDAESEDGAEVDPTKSRWSQMTEEEKYALLHKYPRLEGENTNDWGKRIEAAEGHRIFGLDGEQTSAETPEEEPDKKDKKEQQEDEEDAEKRKNRLMRELSGGAIADWVQKEKGLTRGDLDNLSAEELQKLIDEYEKSKGQEENEAEKLKNELMRRVSEGAIADWVQKEKGLTRGDLDKMSAEELQKLIDEYNHRGDDAGGEKPGKDDGEKAPKTKEALVAATIDVQKDAKDAARLIAENMLNDKLATGGKLSRMIKGVVWGQMFREGVIQRYQKQAMEMILAKQNGESTELSDKDWSSSKAGIERFVAAYVEGMRDEMISTDAGEKMDVFGLEKDDNGEEHAYRYGQDAEGNRTKERLGDDSVEAEATRSMHDAISQYAQGKLTKEQFENQMRLVQKSLNDEGANTDLMVSNFMGVAEAAKERFDHQESIESIMDGFTFINGEARRNVRTEAHRDALDKITERLSNSAIGRILPPEVIGTAASIATNVGKSGLRTALISAGTVVVGATMAPAVVPVAVGALTAGVLASVKERNRVTKDRETQARRMAQGETAGDTGYDESMERTQYSARSAETYTKNIDDALASGDTEKIKSALAEAEAAVKLSDRDTGKGRIDLIRYSSGDVAVIEQQRMDLAVSRAKAKAALKKEGVAFDSDVMTKAIKGATQSFEKDISAKDTAFRKLRARRVAAQGVKSAVVAGATSIISQEVVAAFDPKQYGVFDRVFHLKNEDNAQATLLSGALGLNKQVVHVDTEAAVGVRGMTPERQKELEDMGYTVKQGQSVREVSEGTVSGEEYFKANGNSECSSWLNNGTNGSDGTELQGYYRAGEGPYTVARGIASNPSTGESYNLSQIGSEGMKFYMRATPDSAPIAVNAITDASGNIVPDYSSVDSVVGDMLRDCTFYQIQAGIPTGSNNGMETFSSIWTFGGSGQIPAEVTTQVETFVPTVDVIGFDKTLDMAVTSFPAIGAARRKNLTRGRTGSGDAKVRVPTGVKVPVNDTPSGGGTPPKAPTPTSPKPPVSGERPPKMNDGTAAEIIDVYTTPPGFGENPPATNGPDRIARTPNPSAEASVSTKAAPEAAEAPTAEVTTARIVRPGDIELPGVPTKAYEMVDADSHATLVEISDDDLKALVPENRVATAKVALDRWNSIPSDMRRKYLEADSDETTGLDADSLDIAKTVEAFGLIKSNHAGELASGVTAAPKHGAHADALDEIDPDAVWEAGQLPDYKDTITLYTPGDIRVNMSDDDIRKVAHNPVMDESELKEVRDALYNWNMTFEEEQRRILGNSRYKSKNIDEASLKKLEDLGIINRENYKFTFTIKDSNGRPVTFTPGYERTANNSVSAFKPQGGRAA